jgi:D-alanyl-D-alanine endopeptidase (penicillin-binding protein 7)
MPIMKPFFSSAVKGCCWMIGLCTLSLSVNAALTMEQQPRTAPLGWSDDQARQIMSEGEAFNELAVDVRQLPTRPVAPPPAATLTTIVERVRTTGSQFTEDAVKKVQEALSLNANAVLVMDGSSGDVLYDKKADQALPMASITKVMTAMVVADARLDMAEKITLEPSDFVGPKQASSNLRVGDTLNRAEMMLMALMKSENPAAKSLARTYPGGYNAFMRAMNAKAKSLGMTSAFFGDPTGLDPRNVASPRDLARMVSAAYDYGVIRQFSTQQSYDFNLGSRVLRANNTNSLVRNGSWNIGLSKTGYINEAGRCVVMQAQVNQRPAVIVLMGGSSSQSRAGDATRILSWLQDRFTR